MAIGLGGLILLDFIAYEFKGIGSARISLATDETAQVAQTSPAPQNAATAALVPRQAASPTADRPQALKSIELRQEYSQNEVGADQKHKDKTLEVTGMVSVVYQVPGLHGISFGQLQDPLPPLLCDVAPQDRELLARLKPGQTVTVRGVCQGKIQGGFIGLAGGRVTQGP